MNVRAHSTRRRISVLVVSPGHTVNACMGTKAVLLQIETTSVHGVLKVRQFPEV